MFKSCTVNSKDYPKPNRSDNQQHPHPTQDASLRTNGGPSRLYQASRGSHSATRTTETQKTDGDRSGSPVSNADPERSDSIIQSRADVSRIIDMFDRQSAPSSSSSSTLAGRRHPNSSRITGTGQRSSKTDVAPSSFSIVKSRIDAKDANSAIVFAADSDPPVPGSSADRWKGSGGPGGPGDDDEDRQSLVESASDASVATSSGYSTDLSTDHAVSLLPQLLPLLHSNGEPAETEEEDQEDHPYFARLAAEAEGPTPILGRSGSFRGFKNLVRAGIASILDKTDGKKSVNYGLSERGKVVFYTTSVTVVRDTFDKCYSVKRILQTQMVEFEEKDVFLSKSTQQELIDRLHPIDADLPQVFVDGYHLGGAEEIERLNEDGTLRRIFSNFKKVQQSTCCVQCGGYRFVPCSLCNGSKKARRNRFTDEFCALRCTKCDDNGLVRCNTCNNAAVDDGDPRDD